MTEGLDRVTIEISECDSNGYHVRAHGCNCSLVAVHDEVVTSARQVVQTIVSLGVMHAELGCAVSKAVREAIRSAGRATEDQDAPEGADRSGERSGRAGHAY